MPGATGIRRTRPFSCGNGAAWGEVILTSDAHSPETVAFGYRQAAEMARAAGLPEYVLLTGRGGEPCPCDTLLRAPKKWGAAALFCAASL